MTATTDADELAGEQKIGGFGKRLEAGEFDGVETHGSPCQTPAPAAPVEAGLAHTPGRGSQSPADKAQMLPERRVPVRVWLGPVNN